MLILEKKFWNLRSTATMFYLLFSVEICNTLENLTYVPKSFQGDFAYKFLSRNYH